MFHAWPIIESNGIFYSAPVGTTSSILSQIVTTTVVTFLNRQYYCDISNGSEHKRLASFISWSELENQFNIEISSLKYNEIVSCLSKNEHLKFIIFH